MSPAGRPFLAFFRAGPNSLHRRLLTEDPSRNWDCAVSRWSPAQPVDAAPEMCTSGGDNKFDGFLELWRNDPRARGYRYYLLLDDDIYFAPGDISRFFAICERYRIELCQPALKWNTFYNLNVTLENPICQLRRVSFVEIMAPCFSVATIEKLLPTFSSSRSTWGIDWAWACLMRERGKLHVVDAVAIEHTKPMDVRNGAFYRKLREQGVDFVGELNQARERYGEFGAMRTCEGPHVYREGLPAPLGFVLMHLFEDLKFFARQQKKLKRYWNRRAVTAR